MAARRTGASPCGGVVRTGRGRSSVIRPEVTLTVSTTPAWWGWLGYSSPAVDSYNTVSELRDLLAPHAGHTTVHHLAAARSTVDVTVERTA